MPRSVLLAAYRASKDVVRLLTKAAALEFNDLGQKIHVNSIPRSSVQIEMVRQIFRR